jgi:peptide/nickel transport system substrate-binding protein
MATRSVTGNWRSPGSMKTASVALITGAILACCAACRTASSASELKLCIAGDPNTFDPIQESDENSGIVLYLTGGTLLRIDPVTDQVRPELAESWTIDPAGHSITFELRAGLKFSDGTPLTADDFARTMRMAFDPKNASPFADSFRSERGLPEIDVASPLRFTVRYPVVKAGLQRLFDDLYVRYPGGSGQSASRIEPSAGPFFVSDYRSGVAVNLKRNPWYWKHDNAGKQLPYLDTIRLDIQSNHDIEVDRFLRGETEMIRKLNPEDFARVARQMPTAARDIGPSMDADFLWFNQAPAGLPDWKQKWFASAVFRHAVSAAINREDVARIAWLTHAHPAAGPLSPANAYWFNRELKPLPFDPDFALRTLRIEGFALQDGILRDKDSHPVEFSLITNAGNKARQETAALIQADLRKIGIQISIVTLDFGSLVGRITKTSQYDACLLGFTNMAVDPNDQMNFWLSSGPQHAWRPAQKSPATAWEARIDQLVLAQASEPSRELRLQAFNEVQKIMMEQEPMIYLVNPDYLAALAPPLRDTRFTAIFPQPLSNIETLRLR